MGASLLTFIFIRKNEEFSYIVDDSIFIIPACFFEEYVEITRVAKVSPFVKIYMAGLVFFSIL